ncbi:hypothetical protein [Nonomuraea soli]|uniref:Ferredoxin n=1 Tax=Nonomuraea soli TaxID=1032476 RepID=A0A7W0HVU0_9ACTN|nr:hypothetical protein [Nonomuraea soli]MBA2897520.1 hypothetical protein [Nonomuraea soli]
MPDRPAYWNPLPAARQIVSTWDDPERALSGKWEQRNWRNVPGPFYGADTDTCATGPLVAPRRVLCDENGMEFVYRQPQDPAALAEVLDAVWQDPFGGYACDGDDHWTCADVRGWWSERGRVREWAQSLAITYSTSNNEFDRAAVEHLRDFADYLDGDLRDYLRGYLFWLSEGREPHPDEALPLL